MSRKAGEGGVLRFGLPPPTARSRFARRGCQMVGDDGRRMFTYAPVTFLTAMPLRPSVLLLTALLGLTQCMRKGPDPVDTLPPATQSGANTAGCLVDGQPWTARIDFGLGVVASPAATALSNKFATGPHYLSLDFSKSVDEEAQPNNETDIKMYLPRVTQPGTYVFDQTPGPLNMIGSVGTPAYASFTYDKPSPEQVLLTGPATPGRLVVTRYDPGAGIVSGTFEFTARQSPTGPTVHVTEGRFDCTF